jgi:phenylalanyl-tRNA synthetase beta chain
MSTFPITESIIPRQQFKKLLVDRGYSEAITYSFVDAKLIEILDDQVKPLVLANPISNDMAAMRTSLWPGLLQTIQYNQRRQAARVRIFELGVCFVEENGKIVEKQILGGACAGPLYAEQWGIAARMHDFFDFKNDVEALLTLTMDPDIAFEKFEHPALHPGQTARILRNHQPIGFIGAVHPRVLKALELEEPVLVFELELMKIRNALMPAFRSLSKFPAIRRDIAILVEQAINVAELKMAIAQCAGKYLQSISLFDVYQGKNIEPGKKSVALGLILQHPSRTLVEGEVNDIVKEIVKMLSKQFQATLRE